MDIRTYIHLKMLTHSSSLAHTFQNKKPCRREQLLTLLFIFKKNNNAKVIVRHSMIIKSNYALLIFPTSMNWSHFSQNTASRHVYLKVLFEFSSNAAKITFPQNTIKCTLKYEHVMPSSRWLIELLCYKCYTAAGFGLYH